MYSLARPVLFRLDPERAHGLVFGAMRGVGPVGRVVARRVWGPPDPRLAVTVGSLRLPGPIGLAAGLDKNGSLSRFWPELGFGFVELGTVTALAQPGNERPRLFRFPEAGALINRMGFNNDGAEALAARLEHLPAPAAPRGINLGKSKITPLEEAPEDYARSTRLLARHADYLVINVSSPNTPGLRSLQDKGALTAILAAVRAEAGDTPVFIKLAPDLANPALVEAVGVAEEGGAAGIIATNTTIERYGLPDVGPGGLSGHPLHARSVEVVRTVAAASRLPVIGVGGIRDVDDVLRMLAAGASAVQLYSALVFEGPGLVHRLNRDLALHLDAAGVPDLPALVDRLRDR